MVTLQVNIDDDMKTAADTLFNTYGIDTPTAIKMFISSSVDKQSIPFEVEEPKKKNSFSDEYKKAILDFGKTADPTFFRHTDFVYTEREDFLE